jgi:hypothetical protein
MLRTKLSRIIFVCGVLLTFVAIHFTDTLKHGGVSFEKLFSDFADHPWTVLIYLCYLFIPALIASAVIPWCIKWIHSGS